jgi:hypothetical protein
VVGSEVGSHDAARHHPLGAREDVIDADPGEPGGFRVAEPPACLFEGEQEARSECGHRRMVGRHVEVSGDEHRSASRLVELRQYAR